MLGSEYIALSCFVELGRGYSCNGVTGPRDKAMGAENLKGRIGEVVETSAREGAGIAVARVVVELELGMKLGIGGGVFLELL